MARKDYKNEIGRILSYMRNTTSWRGKDAYGGHALPNVIEFESWVTNALGIIDEINKIPYNELPFGQRVACIASPKLEGLDELEKLNSRAIKLHRLNKPYEKERDRMCEIIDNITDSFEEAFKNVL